MLISFFEEYPTEENLAKLRFVDFPTKLYIASHSIDEFKSIKASIKSKHVKDIVYWPILSVDEGYWLSPFSGTSALLRVMEETNGKAVLWDAELPRKRMHLITRLPFFWGNRALIREFIRQKKGEVLTAEYFPENGLFGSLLHCLGLSFSPKEYGNHQVKMVYSSMHDYSEHFVRKEIMEGVKQFGDKFVVALGVLAVGMKGDEKQISPDILERDLKIAKECGVREVIVYRLGGLDGGYAKVIKKFAG